ncbi:type III pantothenate kinase [Hugenholtzia roseola]|uniref:type III pantothenate kinase n=1 Tax=Hugenholtzia roseola TaxID=1002 RepID=UPI0004077AAF|nr:type III pantothenate kinase [Hugenholtzia roseola]
MKILTLDIGNTRAKAALFERKTEAGKALVGFQPLFQHQNLTDFLSALQSFCAKEKIEVGVFSTVRRLEADFETALSSLGFKWLPFQADAPLPIQTSYQTPHTLGLDRLAGVLGADYLYPNEKVLVVDAGTCITYDLLDRIATEKSQKVGVYRGGSISLGLQMRWNALAHFTAKLPLVSALPLIEAAQKEADFWEKWHLQHIGVDTHSSLVTGVLKGLLGEIGFQIQSYYQKEGIERVLFCGGDTSFFENMAKNSIFASSFPALAQGKLAFSFCYDLLFYGLYHYTCHQIGLPIENPNAL